VIDTRARLAQAIALLGMLAGGCRREAAAPSKRALFEADQTRTQEEWLRQEPVRLLHDYVRIDTSSPTRGERAGAEFLKEFFDCAGIASEIVCPTGDRCNLLARLPGKSRNGALLLLNHIDVAEADPKTWKEGPPFEGRIRNGYLVGRGSYDMKSIGIAEALAMRRLKERGIVPNSDILFLGEADEEAGQEWGTRWLLDHRPEWFEGVANVLNEGGTSEMVLRDVRYWGIETVQAGYAFADLEAPTAEALEALQKRYASLDPAAVEPHPHVVLGFDMLANHLGSPLTDPLRHLDRVRKDPAELAILPDRYAAFLQPRIHWVGPRPAPAGEGTGFRSFVLISIPPGLDPRPFLAPILATPGFHVLRASYGGPAPASPYPTPMTDILKRVSEAFFPGVPFGPLPTFGGYTTSILFRQKGFPTYGYSPIGMNVTDSINRHGHDERVYVRDYLTGCQVYADALEEIALYLRPGDQMSALWSEK
jgi:acetylornithine deacetylase/succinyl-diaminopimelate desuccinylase-like protein